jgi:hypothetical protein
MVGEFDCRSVNSVAAFEKILISNLSMAGPEGYQYSDGAVEPFASLRPFIGNCCDIELGRTRREKESMNSKAGRMEE